MDNKSLLWLFKINHSTIKINTEGITDEESLIQPPNGGNCMNWILGHIVVSRNTALKLVGENPIMNDEETEVYKRGSEPLTDESKALPLNKLFSYLDESQERLKTGLSRMSRDDLNAVAEKKTVGEELAFLHFHEAYHSGQIGLLRRIAGKEGKIK